jgi:hypothetical protein
MKTIQEQYNQILEGKGDKDFFMKSIRRIFPQYITKYNSFSDAVKVLKNKNIITEAKAKGPKAEEKKPSKEVKDSMKNTFDNTDTKNIDNLYGNSFLNGFYAEMQDPKNKDKSIEELKQIVAKNMAKNRSYYNENYAFGIKGIGYKTSTETKEVKGKYKSSGYGDLKESMSLVAIKGIGYKTFTETKEILTIDLKINGKLLSELLSNYNSYIGGYNDEIYEILDNVENKISENKWYTVNDIINLDPKNKNIICGAVLVFAFSMDSENNINNNYFADSINAVKPSEDGVIYGLSKYDIEYYQNLLSYVGRGFFYDLSKQINSSPEEWYKILGDEAFDSIAGTINTGDISYPQSDIAKLKNNSQKYSSILPSEMGDELEIELASLRAKNK